MKVTFIRPNMSSFRAGDALEPLALGILSALTPPEISRVLYDDRIEPIPFAEKTDLVAITVETYTAKRAYRIALEYRKQGIPVVLGGFHPTFLPEEAKDYCDAVVIGDAEGTWPQVLKDYLDGNLKSGQPVRFYRNPETFSLTQRLEATRVDRQLFQGKRYSKISLVQFGRGCKFHCDFCSIHAFYNFDRAQRPLHSVVSEIQSLKNKNILFVDDNLFTDVPRSQAFLEALIPLKIRWFGQLSIDITRHEHLMRLLKKSGCTLAIVGFESLQEDNLTQMNKAWVNRQGGYEQAIKKFREHGIMLHGTFVFGYDHDNEASFEQTLKFAKKSKFMLAHFNPLTPTPETALYQRLKKEGRLLCEPWWLHSDYRYGEAHFTPKKMLSQELQQGCYRIRSKFNSWESILQRAWDYKANARNPFHLFIFMLANWISRREIHKKQGIALGGNL